MKSFLFLLLLLSAVGFAQQPLRPVPRQSGFAPSAFANAEPDQALPENYLLTLTILEKEQVVTEMSLVIATPEFKADFPDANSSITTFVGTIVPAEDGTVLVRYAMGAEIAVKIAEGQTQYKTTSLQASVRLKPGEPVQITKTDSRSCRLSISRLSGQPTKAK